MCRTRSEQFKEEGILSVVFDPDLGLCGWLGDKRIDNEVYGFGPRQDFVRALEGEIRFQIGNMGGLGEHSTLRRVYRRFRQGLEKRCQVFEESPTSKIAWGSFSEDPYVALEEVRKLLGLSENQLDFLLALLGKADDGYLHFHVGNVCVDFFNRSSDEKEMVLEIDVENGNMTHSLKYLLKTQPKDEKAVHVDT